MTKWLIFQNPVTFPRLSLCLSSLYSKNHGVGNKLNGMMVNPKSSASFQEFLYKDSENAQMRHLIYSWLGTFESNKLVQYFVSS